jgi:Tfp pilus assembly protein PilF
VPDASELPLSLRLENAAVSYVAYIGKMLWPAKLAVFYPHPGRSLSWPDVMASAFILVAITMAVLYFHRARYLAMGWFLFVTTLIPVIGIVQVGRQAMADRYAYVPCIGLFIVIAWGLSGIANAAVIPRVVPAVAALCLILAFAACTSRYLPYWQNGVELFTQARSVAGRPDFVIEEGLAENLVSARRFDEAFSHYREACALRPAYARCHYKMAELLFDRGQLRSALEEYQFVEGHTDSKDIALLCLIGSGEILMDLGDYETAEMKLAAALRIDPNNNKALLLHQRALKQKSGQKSTGTLRRESSIVGR